MALGILSIIFISLIVVAVVLQILLYKGGKNSSNNIAFLLNIALVILLSFLIFSSLPSNFTMQKIISISWSALALLSLLLRSKGKDLLSTSKIILTIAIIGSLAQLLI